jgi:predicted nucleic acid-binding protein
VDRVFLDANILFSAAYKPGSPLRHLWQLGSAELITSVQAVLEAHNNLSAVRPARLPDLAHLLQSVTIFSDPLPGFVLPAGINLPDKDKPILQAAIDARATHLVTGDVKHFGRYYGQTIAGVLILPPAQYLQRQQRNP